MKLACCLALLAFHLTAQTQLPTITKVDNFGGASALSASAYAFVTGTNLGTNPEVLLGATQCELFYISDTVLSFQVPSGTATGASTVTVQTAAGTSHPFAVAITPTSPAIVDRNLIPPAGYFTSLTSNLLKFPTPSPGDYVYVFVDGVGPSRPPVPPQIQIDGNNVPVLSAGTNVLYIGPSLTASLGEVPEFEIRIPSLPGGKHTLQAIAGGLASPAVTFTIINNGLFTSQTGLTFNAAQGGPAVPSQSFSVLSGSGTINFSVVTNTIGGGAWLSAAPVAGGSTVDTAGAPIQVQANASKLATGAYYGNVTIASPDAPNSPQSVTVVLNVSATAAPSIDKTGLIFVRNTTGPNPPAQTVTAFNPSAGPVSFTASLQGAGASFFQVTPATGAVASGQSQPINVQLATAIPVGVTMAQLTLSFSDGTIRTVSLLLIVAAGVGSSADSATPDTSSCTPTKLLPVFTLLGDSFSVPAAWPTAIQAMIVDDCSNPMNAGEAVVSFNNGDPAISLQFTAAGTWSGTWPPGNPRASVVLTLAAAQAGTRLTGSAQITGGVNANPTVPQVSTGGVVDTAAYGSPVAPGDLIAIFGADLSANIAGAASLPLPDQLLTTSVSIDGQSIPLLYTSRGQVNAVVPYSLPTDVRHQLLAQRDNSLSVPQSVIVGVARPGVFTIDSSGSGQGEIFTVDSAGNQILADKSAPAKAGDILVIYCSGLGAVTPPLVAGTATPLTFLTTTVDTLTATIGGMPAVVMFSGLTPGSSGLYQVNAVVPAGLPDSDTTPLQLTISGQQSAIVTLAVGM
ncbi:MAG TPA: IPT/TIG domain-containing protein [Bryobacteraceae bacterium]|nr:IPT/TIG domain-containing protein [Bryobacteraceae bacterium]